jgi:hypothetical protein
MALLLNRPSRIDRITLRIDRLGERAAKLLEREEKIGTEVETLRTEARQPAGRLRSRLRARSIGRKERSMEKLHAERGALVDREIRTIMIALQEQSRRTREQLDQELERLAPVEAEWERLRSTFESLEATVNAPALEELAGQWRGALGIPEFPLTEREGYTKPFPQRALLF